MCLWADAPLFWHPTEITLDCDNYQQNSRHYLGALVLGRLPSYLKAKLYLDICQVNLEQESESLYMDIPLVYLYACIRVSEVWVTWVVVRDRKDRKMWALTDRELWAMTAHHSETITMRNQILNGRPDQEFLYVCCK